MNRLQAYYEQFQYPIKTIFIGCFMIALGTFIQSPYVNQILKLDSLLLTSITNIILYSGGIILSYFPLLVFIKFLSSKVNETNHTIVGIIAYGIFLLSMAMLSPKNLPAASYSSLFNIQFAGVKYELMKTGVVGLLAVYMLIRYIYRKKGLRVYVSQVSYIDRETLRLTQTIIGAMILGVVFANVWPLFIKNLYVIIDYIASDVNNPMNMFTYGSVERVLALLNLSDIPHQEFWLGSAGGSWMNLAGQTFTGDVNIWSAQLKETVNILGASGSGRFTSAYYVINMFSIPGYLCAIWSTITMKKYNRTNLLGLIIAIIFSLISGILLPIELLMLVTTPVIYIFHLFMVSFTYALLNAFNATVGFSYLGNLATATPGTIMDFLGLLNNAIVFDKLMIIAMVGVISFVLYFLFTRFYFRKMAIDVLNVGSKQERVVEFIERLGGLDNIEAISNTSTRVHVTLIDRDKLNVAGLHRQGVTRIVESRAGYALSFGAASYIIQNEINKALKSQPSKQVEETYE